MENFLEQVESIRKDGTVYFSYASDHDLPWISTDDIGDEAAKYLLSDHWAGQWTRNLMGSENLTLPETAAILSQVLDRPVEYVQVTIKSLQHQLASAGATADVQKEFGELFQALGDQNGIYATARTPEAVTPTTFEQFVRNKLLPAMTTSS